MRVYYKVKKFNDFIIADKSATQEEISKVISEEFPNSCIESPTKTKLGYDYEEKNHFIFEWKNYDIFSYHNKRFNQNENFFDGEVGKLLNTGRLQIKNYVGTILFMKERFNVYSEKMEFKQVYKLAEYIDKRISRLSMKFNHHNETRAIFEKNYLKSQNKYNVYIYIYNLLNSGKLKTEINSIISDPHVSFDKSIDSFDLSRGDKIEPEIMNEFFSGNAKYSYNKNKKIVVEKFKRYIPENTNYYREVFTLDNNENQFILFFLKICMTLMRSFINEISQKDKDTYFINKIKNLIKELQILTNHKIFKNVSDLKYLNRRSTVLTKTKGYSRIFQYYIEMNNNPISLDNYDDYIELFQNKSIDKLYEYYALFKIDDILSNIYEMSEEEKELIPVHQGLNVSINESTKGIMIRYTNSALPTAYLMFQTSYNRRHGSYSTTLIPDFTLKIEGEKDVGLYHLDTKFRNLKNDINDNQSGLNSVIKDMHAYKDGIYNSEGAYVLYPTHSETQFFTKESPDNKDEGSIGYISFKINKEKKDFINFVHKILKKYSS